MFCPNCATKFNDEQTACRKCGMNLAKIAEEFVAQNPKKIKKRFRKLRIVFEIIGFLFVFGTLLAGIGSYFYYVVYKMIYLHDKDYFATGIIVTALISAAILAVLLFLLAGLIERKNKPVEATEEFRLEEQKKPELPVDSEPKPKRINKVRAKKSAEITIENEPQIILETAETETVKPIELSESTEILTIEMPEPVDENAPRSIFSDEHLLDIPTFESVKPKRVYRRRKPVEMVENKEPEVILDEQISEPNDDPIEN